LLAGGGLALLLLIFPGFYGEGYESVKDLASFHTYRIFENSFLGNFTERNTWIFILAIFLSALIKSLASSLTLGGGGNGGQFAPSLFMGAHLGFAFAKACHKIGILSVSISNFTIVGMAGIISGFFFAPMSAIFLIAELTNGYELMIPLMLVSALSYSVAVRFSPVKIRKMAPRPDADQEVLQHLPVHRLMETDYDVLTPEMTIQEFIPVLERSAHNTFPVTSHSGELVGILAFSKVKDWVFRTEFAEKLSIGKLMQNPAERIFMETDSSEEIFEKFDRTRAFRLPVVGKNNQYMGFITKGALLSEYRKELLGRS
jgi:CIC family chloride channel protein